MTKIRALPGPGFEKACDVPRGHEDERSCRGPLRLAIEKEIDRSLGQKPSLVVASVHMRGGPLPSGGGLPSNTEESPMPDSSFTVA